MTQFTVNASGYDPYKNFRFRVKWENRYVAGMSKMGALKRTTEVVRPREQGEPTSARGFPGRTEFDRITLEGGVTHDADFILWAQRVWGFGEAAGSAVSLQDFRKDIYIEVCNELGLVVIGYKVYRCWVSEYQALSEFAADTNTMVIQHITLENEGWEREA